MRKITVNGQIVSNNGLTLFTTNGESHVFPNDGWETQKILDVVLPALSKRQPIEIDLDEFSLAKQIEKASGGAIKTDASGAMAIETKAGTVDIRPLQGHVERAMFGEGMKGFKRFMASFEEVMAKRKHSATELLSFLEGSELPLADDGSIIGYKMLRDGEGEAKGYMVDPHTRRVRQKLGTLVYMPESKVDDNRRQLCSTGLHIARVDYLSGGWGGNLCLVKIKPGDVIAVPLNERSKMRVSAYHIVAVLPKDVGARLLAGTKIEDVPEAMKILGKVVAGDHVGVLARTKVGAQGEHEIEELAVKERTARKVKEKKVTLARAKGREKIDPKKVRDQVKAIKAAETQRDPAYAKKLAKAQADFDKGMSIRNIAKKHKMDRESLGKNLDRSKRS